MKYAAILAFRILTVGRKFEFGSGVSARGYRELVSARASERTKSLSRVRVTSALAQPAATGAHRVHAAVTTARV